ncbi:MAG: AMP-binding protein, partial [Rhabdaerophilum sp.]
MNLAHVLRQNARRFPEKPGFIWGGQSWNWVEIEREVNALAAALQARGLGKGDRLIVHSKNTAQMFFSLFAAFKLGVVWVPTNFRLMPEEVIYLADFSGAKGFLCHGDFPAHAEAVAKNVPGIEFIWRMDEQAKPGAFGEAGVSERMAAFRGHSVPDAPVEHDDPCWYFFTSGTTGRSKAAVLTHGQMAFVITNHLCD